MRSRLTLIFLALACTSVLAQVPDGRRRMYPTQDGFLEIDPRSGAITECKRVPEGYRRERVTEGDALLIEDGGSQAQAPAPPRPPPSRSPSTKPTEEEVDRALGVMERFLRRFMDIVREGQSLICDHLHRQKRQDSRRCISEEKHPIRAGEGGKTMMAGNA
jgi:hypothetical protein